MFYWLETSALCSGFTKIKKKNAKFSTLSLYSFFFFFFFAIAKISTREIRLPNIRKIKFARKLVRIRYMTFTREYPPTMLKTYFTSHYYYKKMAWVSCIFACSYSPSHPFPLAMTHVGGSNGVNTGPMKHWLPFLNSTNPPSIPENPF